VQITMRPCRDSDVIIGWAMGFSTTDGNIVTHFEADVSSSSLHLMQNLA